MIQTTDSVHKPLSDQLAREVLLSRLTESERRVLGAGACVSMVPAHPRPDADVVDVGRLVSTQDANLQQTGRYRMADWPSFLEYEIYPRLEPRYLVLRGLSADQDVRISWCDDSGRWRPLHHVYWLRPPAPQDHAAIDLECLLNWPSTGARRIRIQLAGPGEIALQAPPQLLR